MPVRLSIYSVIGERVWDSGARVEDAGIYTKDVDLTNFPAGLYYCRFEAGNSAIMNRKIIMRN